MSEDASSASTSARARVKAVAISPDGEVLGIAEEAYPLSTPQPGWAEQDPEDWWRAAQAALGRVPSGPIGLSGQMHGLVVLDDDDRVIRPAILWNDGRTGEECAEIEAPVGLERLIELTGNRALAGFTAPKLLWLRRHEPETLRADPARAAAEGLRPPAAHRRARDRRRRRLGHAALRRRRAALVGRGVRRARGADRVAAAGVVESTEVGGAGDQAAAALGVGIDRPGPVSVALGTAGIVFARAAALRARPRAPRSHVLPRGARARGTRWA